MCGGQYSGGNQAIRVEDKLVKMELKVVYVVVRVVISHILCCSRSS